MSVDISNPSALTSSLNISQAGEIPVGGLQTWALALHCGPYDAEVDLSLRINVSLSRRNTTSLDFRRKKICLKDKSNAGPEEVLVAASGSSTGGQVFYAAIGCACAFIAAIFVLVIAYYVRDKKTRRHRDPLQYVYINLILLFSSPVFAFTFDSISLLLLLPLPKRVEGFELRVQRGEGDRSRARANLFITRNTPTCLSDVHLDVQKIGRPTEPRIAREDSRDHRTKVGEIFSLSNIRIR